MLKYFNIINLPTTTSTQDHLISLIKNTKTTTPPTAVITQKQTQGRGRNGKWLSHKDDLTMSICWPFPNYPTLQSISLVISLIIIRILHKLQINALVKWPNDILLENKKLAGIITETIAKHNHIYAIIGIGINLKKPTKSSTRISLPQKIINKHILASKILQALPSALSKLQQKGFKHFKKEWESYHCLQNMLVKVTTARTIIKGYVQGIDENGFLLLNVNGTSQTILSGSVRTVNLPEAITKRYTQ